MLSTTVFKVHNPLIEQAHAVNYSCSCNNNDKVLQNQRRMYSGSDVILIIFLVIIKLSIYLEMDLNTIKLERVAKGLPSASTPATETVILYVSPTLCCGIL